VTNINPVQSLRYTLVPDVSVATSGNTALTFSAWPVTGRILGVEVGSPAFNSATGSLYLIASGNTWNQNRTIATINGIAQARTIYSIVSYQRGTDQGTILSGTNWSSTEHPLVDGDAIGLATSGTFAGTGLFIVYYQ
jgi:hypothetical protein